MTDFRMVYVTAGSKVEAETIGRMAVEHRLAACANIIGPAASIYWWDGAVQSEPETILILKTVAPRVTDLVEMIRSMHSYDCPGITVLPIEGGNPSYLDWIAAETNVDAPSAA